MTTLRRGTSSADAVTAARAARAARRLGGDADTEAAARAVREGVVRLARRLQAQRQDAWRQPDRRSRCSAGSTATATATPKALADAEDAQPQALTRGPSRRWKSRVWSAAEPIPTTAAKCFST